MAHMVQCAKYKTQMEGLDEPPFDSDFGNKIYHNVSKQAWGEWLERQKMLLNEYRLQPWTREAQEFLVEQMDQFFFGEGFEVPYVPPLRRNFVGYVWGRARCKLSQTPRFSNATVGTWLSLVEHSLGVRGVGSSNLPVPTNDQISKIGSQECAAA